MIEVEVIDEPKAAAIALDPLKSRLLAELSEPTSAAGLAVRVELPRQKVHYHLRALQQHGLVTEAGQRAWGGITERLFVATAQTYVVSPGALGPVAADPARSKDRLSASYLVAVAARAVREVGALIRRATETRKRLATLSIDTTIRFRSAEERAAFTRELTESIAQLGARYHDESAPGGRPHRLLVLAHPAPPEKNPATEEEKS